MVHNSFKTCPFDLKLLWHKSWLVRHQYSRGYLHELNWDTNLPWFSTLWRVGVLHYLKKCVFRIEYEGHWGHRMLFACISCTWHMHWVASPSPCNTLMARFHLVFPSFDCSKPTSIFYPLLTAACWHSLRPPFANQLGLHFITQS